MIRAFLSSGLLYEDALHHNCVFVGRDAEGVPRFANQRGTYDQNGPGFKGDVSGSDKSIDLRLPSRPDLDWALVFEAPIDLMSYLTLHRKVTSNAVALCGLYEGALDTYLRDNPAIRQIALCLDADGPGQTAAEQFQTKYEKLGYTVKIKKPPRGSDWNEYLQQRSWQKERGGCLPRREQIRKTRPAIIKTRRNNHETNPDNPFYPGHHHGRGVSLLWLPGKKPLPARASSSTPSPWREYTYGEAEEPRINKVYQLSLSDDPSGIPTEDFVRNGRRYYLLDMTRKNEVGVDTKPHIETVTQASSTDDMETILQQLSAELEVTTEDGYTGTLQLDHTTVKVTVDGYATKTQALSASRNYPNLSEADVSPHSKKHRGERKDPDPGGCPMGQHGTDRRRGWDHHPLYRYRKLHRHQQLTLCHRLHRNRGLYRRGGQARLRCCDLYSDLRQHAGIRGNCQVLCESLRGEDSPLAGGAAIALTAGGVFVFQKIKKRR